MQQKQKHQQQQQQQQLSNVDGKLFQLPLKSFHKRALVELRTTDGFILFRKYFISLQDAVPVCPSVSRTIGLSVGPSLHTVTIFLDSGVDPNQRTHSKNLSFHFVHFLSHREKSHSSGWLKFSSS